MKTAEERVNSLASAAESTVTVAESCTGGMICARLTDIPGSSACFPGGFVTYGNGLKESVLGVDHTLLLEHGAVSGPVAAAMARGARLRSGATVALAVTGIAGPGGGSPGKPVGLVFTALDWDGGTAVASHRFSGSRAEVRRGAADAALEMLAGWLAGEAG